MQVYVLIHRDAHYDEEVFVFASLEGVKEKSKKILDHFVVELLEFWTQADLEKDIQPDIDAFFKDLEEHPNHRFFRWDFDIDDSIQIFAVELQN